MFKLYFYFLQFLLKIQSSEKVLDIKARGNNQNQQIM